MRIHLAGTGTPTQCWTGTGMYDFHRLDSFPYMNEQSFADVPRFRSFMMDSGAFTYMNGGKRAVDWEAYVDKYAAAVRRLSVRNYIELDIDSVVGLPEVLRLRARLEAAVGWPCMPVWHTSRGIAGWRDMLASHAYVCIGGIVTGEIRNEHVPAITEMVRAANRAGIRVHGLGMTKIDWMLRIPFHSVDSSSWLRPARFGGVMTFNGERIVTVTSKIRTKPDKATHHSFREWIKFANHMENQ